MKQLVLRGLRGGIGATSLLAGLGIALHEQGERVLLIDLSPDNMLRLHFSVDIAYASGWARAQLDAAPWHESALELLPGLHLLPYGELGGAEISQIEGQLCADSSCWAQRCDLIGHNYDWVLFDLPQRLPGHRAVVSEANRADVLIDLATPDPG
ncbi:MAG TPA: cellulose synthase operon protein YhjQ, partial [Pseudomonas sp.]|nr:cellulose synthase operon protein YhjQ [Pseudomonas sp.]